MNTKNPPAYGEEAWFENKFANSGYQQAGGYYAHSVNGYHKFRYQLHLQFLKQHISSQTPIHALDVGCGVGDFLHLIQKNFTTGNLVGVDFVKPVAETAAQRFPELYFLQDSLPKLNKVEGKFDLIIASEVLYYLNESERQQAIKRLHSLLQDNGLLFVSATLAPHTFSKDTLRMLVSLHFTVQDQLIQNSRFYLKLIHPIQLAYTIDSVKYSDNWSIFYKKIYRFFHYPIIGPTLSALNKLFLLTTKPVLRSQKLPMLLTKFGDVLGSRWAGSNIIMLLQKKG